MINLDSKTGFGNISIETSDVVFKDLITDNGIVVKMLRLDQFHRIISGNKWFKLQYNIAFAKDNNFSTLITFGGGHSNHLVATAAAAKEFNLTSIGIVRGNYNDENITATLKQCIELGMQLEFITREEYSKKEDQIYLEQLQTKHPNSFIIPEGGNNNLGIKGTEEIAQYISSDFTHVAVSVGTGTTFTGLRNTLPERIKLLGFVPMKNGTYLAKEIQPTKNNWQLIDDFHFGGFGKWNDELIGFMNDFYEQHQIPLDIVYTSKMMYELQKMITNNFFESNSKILCIHTGGLQGNASVQDKLHF